MRERDSGSATAGFLPGPRLPPPEFATADITVAAPPDMPQPAHDSPTARLVPVLMAAATVGMVAVVFLSRSGMTRNPMFVGFPLLMLVSAAIGAVTGRGRRRAEIDADRRDYLGYLSELRVTVTNTAVAQRLSLSWCHPEPDALWTLVGGTRMWERRPADSDFCRVRIGVGTQRLATRLVAPRLGPVDRLDPVTATALRRFLSTHSTIPEVPIAIALRGVPAVTIAGAATPTGAIHARGLLRAMICQLAVLHSPTRVLIAGVISAANRADWDWLKWLPHNQHPRATDDVGPARMVYPTLAAAETALDDLLVDRAPGETLPHLVIVVDGDVAGGSERVVAGRGIAGVTIVAAGTGCDGFAAADGLRLRVSAERLAVGDEVFARPDLMSLTAASVCARRLAAFHADGRDAVPAGGQRWQDLAGIGDPAAFVPTALWHSVSQRERLRVPIGTTVGGVPLELDIKEAAEGGMGPHGLCVGATGSGKSELLRTVALGMIARHSPETLNLVLVDFKGGATFLGFVDAPHVAAVITNLADEAPLVARLHDALTGEMTRRQHLLRAAGNLDSVAAYQDARRAGAQLAAVPTLFIIVDEFSELLSQHPDFADIFVAIGRLGRSLGMHLLLASQRLDEGRLRGLESHLSYRVCLKTLSPTESRIVLGTSDAYELPNVPGIGYLRTGTAESIRFQTAYVSGPCPRQPVHAAPRHDDTAPPIRRFTAAPTGPVTMPHRTDTIVGRSVLQTVLQTVVDRVCGYGPPAHQIWLPPLGSAPALDCLLGEAGSDLTVAIGIVDRPFEQRRTPLTVDLSGPAGNVAVVGAPQSGKSTALRTLIAALAAAHDPNRLQFYCLDFGGGALTSVQSWPHVGSVATRAEPDLVGAVIAQLHSLIRSREAAFRGHGIDSMAQYRLLKEQRVPACDRFGDVFLVVDGWAGLCHEFDALEAPIIALAAQGLSFGVHVVVSATRWAELRPALKDQIGTRIELRLGDPADSELDRRRARLVPEGQPGRGLSRDGLHMIVALPRLDGVASTQGLADAGEQIGQLLRRRAGAASAPPIPLLPTHVDHHALVEQAPEGILLGLEGAELGPVALDFHRHSHVLILGGNECGKTNALRTVCREITRTATARQAQLFVVDFGRTLLGVVRSEHLGGYAMSAATLDALLPDLLYLLGKRMPPARITQQQLLDRSWWSGPDLYVVIDDYDLVATAAGNPLTAITEYLPHARDLGLHLLVARRSGGAARAMFEPLLAGLRDLGCLGLMMSAAPEDGPLFGSLPASPLPPGRGVLITRGGGRQLVQVAWSPPP